MFKIYDGREHFYQWDIDRKLIVEDPEVKEVHFCNRTDDCSLVCETYVEDGITLVNVPNILLQTDWKIHVYAYDGSYTKHDECYEVKSRTKPADYVYTETEVWTAEKAVEEALQEAKDSGEFNGKDGYTPQKGVDYWTPEDKAEIIDDMSDEGYVKNTDYATKDVAGVVKVNKDSGIRFADNKTLMIVAADEEAIDKGTSSLRPITPNVLKYAVKSVTYDKAEITNTYATKTELNTFSNNTTEEFQRVREEIDAEHVNTYYTYATKEELADSKKWKTLIDVTLTEEQAGVSEILLAIEDAEAFADARQCRIFVSFPVAEAKAANAFWINVNLVDKNGTAYNETLLTGRNKQGSANSIFYTTAQIDIFDFKENSNTNNTRGYHSLMMLPTTWYASATANTATTANECFGKFRAEWIKTTILAPYLKITLGDTNAPTFEAGTQIFMEVCE